MQICCRSLHKYTCASHAPFHNQEPSVFLSSFSKIHRLLKEVFVFGKCITNYEINDICDKPKVASTF